jgi:hypothetical protein
MCGCWNPSSKASSACHATYFGAKLTGADLVSCCIVEGAFGANDGGTDENNFDASQNDAELRGQIWL